MGRRKGLPGLYFSKKHTYTWEAHSRVVCSCRVTIRQEISCWSGTSLSTIQRDKRVRYFSCLWDYHPTWLVLFICVFHGLQQATHLVHKIRFFGSMPTKPRMSPFPQRQENITDKVCLPVKREKTMEENMGNLELASFQENLQIASMQ